MGQTRKGVVSTDPGTEELRRTPEPEGPDQISEKVRRTREGLAGRLKRSLLEKLGLDGLSPKRLRIITLIALAEIGLLGLSFFTELPDSWLVTAALAILPIAFHQEKDDEVEPETEPGPETWAQNQDRY